MYYDQYGYPCLGLCIVLLKNSTPASARKFRRLSTNFDVLKLFIAQKDANFIAITLAQEGANSALGGI